MRSLSRLARDLGQGTFATFRYLLQTEVHVHALAIAASTLLSFFPFLIICVSLGSWVFDPSAVVGTLDIAFRDVFPTAMGDFMHRNLPAPERIEFLSIFILFFSANGIFEPLEVALNRTWGIEINRSYARNQLVSMVLIFTCGGLTLLSLGLAAMRQSTVGDLPIEQWMSIVFFKLAAIPLTVLVLCLVYRYLPNGRPPWKRILPASIGVAVLLEGLKSINTWAWPVVDQKLQREYGVFRYSATLIFLSFLASMLVLAGAEWASRGHRFDRSEG
jgi:uncharacterized BrkB/YihY/UPF0761 family membrane protein